MNVKRPPGERRVEQILNFAPESEEYIHMFANRDPGKLVLKLSGNKVFDPRIISGLVAIQNHGITPVVIHGGGKQIDEAIEAKGEKTRRKVHGVRPTPPKHMPAVESAMDGITDRLCELIKEMGGKAVGIKSGVFSGWPRSTEDLVLEKISVDTDPLLSVVETGTTVVGSSLGTHSADSRTRLNGNADAAAAAAAEALKATDLIFVQDEPGIMYKGILIPKLTPILAKQLMEDKIIVDGAAEKTRRGFEAHDEGVEVVSYTNDFVGEMFTRKGRGTQLLGQ